VRRHRAAHLPATLQQAHAAAEVTRADGLLEEIGELQRRLRAYESQAASAGDLRVALLALREARATLALIARMTGQLDAAPPPPKPFTPVVFVSVNAETGEEEDVTNYWPPPP
jgi:predicted ABC-type transport system involved in lysophospholipase L1 biosynthesis ATPase subunit